MKPGSRKFARRIGAALFVLATLAAPVFAAEGASPDVADTPTGWVFRWLNFILIFGALAYVLARYGGPYFRGRGAEIGGAIRDAAAAKADAERELREVEIQVANVDQEIVRLRSESDREAEAEAQRQLQAGRREIERIERGAQFEIEASERVCRQQLRELAAQMAVAAAEKEMRVALHTNEPARAALFHLFVSQVNRAAQSATLQRTKN